MDYTVLDFCCDFSFNGYDEIDSNNSDDDFEEKPKAKRTRHEWTDNCVQFVEL